MKEIALKVGINVVSIVLAVLVLMLLLKLSAKLKKDCGCGCGGAGTCGTKPGTGAPATESMAMEYDQSFNRF